MITTQLALSLLALITTVSSLKIQHPGLTQSPLSASRAETIRTAYRTSFSAYMRYAFPHDALLPLTNSYEDPFGGWGATTASDEISLFETNIRYLGGLLSAYELGGKQNQKLVDQAKVVGDHLATGWLEGNALPCNTLKWNDYAKPTCNDTGIAVAGTLILEMDRLSKYTGDSKYLALAKKSMAAIAQSKGVFPGLFAQVYDVKTGEAMDDYVTWGGGSDSFFEYLVKYAYLTGEEGLWLDMWVQGVESSIEHLVTHPQETQMGNLTYLADYSASRGGLLPRWGHLGCFAGGNWILGAKMIGDDRIERYGQALTGACANTYTSSPSGIGPETFVFIGEGNNTNRIKINNRPFYEQHGFGFDITQYVLRPEVVESIFYAYRTTGDTMWQEIAWQAWQAIDRHCLVKSGALAALANVNSTSPTKLDDSESFLYAEVFKYLYLVFADPEVASLDRWVFNTEAHPLMVDRPERGLFATGAGSKKRREEGKREADNRRGGSAGVFRFARGEFGAEWGGSLE
ncbi:Glycoside hydrolase, family 47 [Kalmanozyma brasiliensis GHG001]|uniref:Glycoside hydrolase, family 47 n=1 Tax=Kalmanozyma brasiliensis (strain GHG001) TaxID=1365824 RepID=UPI00286810BA|nr:Glycoside hydrolase, family 47 [Kalmanozyma brasiliensis GHG001]EST07904.2 Glycoside hydrolase, family 47 [Kalmanozyma brasiliensis GHG001]